MSWSRCDSTYFSDSSCPHHQVATDFAFAAFWLMPRLQRFHEAYPQVDVSLVTGERSQGMLRPERKNSAVLLPARRV